MTVAEEQHAVASRFTAMWLEAEKEFAQITGRDLKGSGKATDFKNLMDQFKNKLDPDESDSSSSKKKQKLSKVVEFVLASVRTLGNFAGQAATMVFGGPADMCFNAFRFLIDIPAKIAKVYDDLIKLFGEMSTTLLEFQVLESIRDQKNIDSELLITTNAILVAFVRICGQYIKFLNGGKRHAISVALKSVFLEDDCGVVDALRNFQDLARKQSSMVGTVSYKHILDIEEAIRGFGPIQQQTLEGVQSLVATANDKKAEALIQESLRLVEQKLRIKGATANIPLANLTQMQVDVMDDVCNWVNGTSEYRDWMKNRPKDHLMCIAGGKKSGKKYLLAAIARRLKNPNGVSQTKNLGPIILYYDFPSNDDKKASEKERASAATLVLKILALQAALQSKKYAQDLENALRHIDIVDDKDPSKLWRSLGLSDFLTALDQDVYILLSGLNRLSKDNARDLLNLLADSGSNKTKMPRILVTGAPSLFTSVGGLRLVLNIDTGNEAGIRRYVESEMRKMKILQGDHPSIVSLREALLEQLPGKVHGDFFAVEQKLNRVETAINDSRTQEEVLNVLDDDDHTDSHELMKRRIDDLEKTLSTDDIEELNILLPWLVYGEEPPEVEELELLLRAYGRSSPVLPLERRLRMKYSSVLDVKVGTVHMAEGPRSFLRLAGNESKGTALADSRISLKIEIENAERAVVKRFLWDLTAQFNFASPTFADSDSSSDRKKIRVDAATAYFTIIDKSLQFLSDDFDFDGSTLYFACLKNLPLHLAHVLTSGVTATQKKTICQKLINFFSDTPTLQEKWKDIWPFHSQLVTAAMVTTIEDLFTTSEACLEPIEKRWVTKYIKKQEKRGTFFMPIAELVARNWLCGREWDAEWSLDWINAFMDMQDSKRSEVDATDGIEGVGTNSASTESQASSSNVCERASRAAEWCAKVLHVDSPNALYYERIASALLDKDETDQAIKYLEQALDLPEPDWHIHMRLAMAYRRKNMARQQKEQLEVAIQKHVPVEKGSEQDWEFKDLLFSLALAERKSGEYEAALKHYEQVLELDSNHYCFWECFKLFCERNELEQAGSLLFDKQSPGLETTTSLLAQRLELISEYRTMDEDDPEAAYWLSIIMDKLQMTGEIEGAFHQLSNAKDAALTKRAFCLFNAGFLFSHSSVTETQELGVRHLEECFKFTALAQRDGENITLQDDFFHTYWVSAIREKAAQKLSLWRSRTLLSMKPDHPDRKTDFDNFVDTIKTARKLSDVAPEGRYIGAYAYLCRQLVINGNFQEARNLTKPNAQVAFVILNDDDTENDWQGFRMLGENLIMVGDDLNALSAYSLIAPADLDPHVDEKDQHVKTNGVDGVNQAKMDGGDCVKDAKTDDSTDNTTLEGGEKKRTGPLSQTCDGCREHTWSYANEWWNCKHCPDVQFCAKCIRFLKNRELKRLVCHPEHDFLFIPPWSDDEYHAVGKGRVRVGGHLDADGRRVGGDVVNVQDWLTTIRKIWDLEAEPKPEIAPKEMKRVNTA